MKKEKKEKEEIVIESSRSRISKKNRITVEEADLLAPKLTADVLIWFYAEESKKANYSLLYKNEVENLNKLIRAGREAVYELYIDYIGLIEETAGLATAKVFGNHAVQAFDLCQEAYYNIKMLPLIAKTYQEKKIDGPFSQYLRPSLRREMIRYMYENSLVRKSSDTAKKIQEYEKLKKDGLSNDDICKRLGVKKESTLQKYDSMSHIASLEQSFYEGNSDNSITLGERIFAESTADTPSRRAREIEQEECLSFLQGHLIRNYGKSNFKMLLEIFGDSGESEAEIMDKYAKIFGKSPRQLSRNKTKMLQDTAKALGAVGYDSSILPLAV